MATGLCFFFKSKEKMEFSVCNKLHVSLGPTKIYNVKPWPLLASGAAFHLCLRTKHTPPFSVSSSLSVDRQRFEFKMKLQSQSDVSNEHFFLLLFPLIRAKPNKYHLY